MATICSSQSPEQHHHPQQVSAPTALYFHPSRAHHSRGPVLSVSAVVVAGAGVEKEFVTFELLLKRAGMRQSDIDRGIVFRARQRYSELVSQATGEQNHELAKQVYEMAEDLPSTTTAGMLSLEGYKLNGPLYHGSPLTICHRHQIAHVVKVLEGSELKRVKAFQLALAEHTLSGITSFELVDTARRTAMIMPFYPSNLEQLEYLSPEEGVVNFWKQITTAVGALHSMGFAHMDIKSSNICLKADGEAVLIDLGSVAPIGSFSQSTSAYIPCDFDPDADLARIRARPEVDWWMLAMTLAEKACGRNGMRIGAAARSATKAELLLHLERHLLPEVWIQLKRMLDDETAVPVSTASSNT